MRRIHNYSAREAESTSMKTLAALVFLIVGVACGTPSAMAQSTPASAEPSTKKSTPKKASPGKKEKDPDLSGLTPTNFNCELGNKLTIYRRADDDQHITLQWNKKLYQLARVSTSTGANRFEDSKQGLVWIDIPAKGMLLDSKKGKQLANECKKPEQAAQDGHSREQKSPGSAK
jgi:hypothetical protein